MIDRIALCIFAYNRPEELQKTLKNLERCKSLDCVDIHLFSDGPKQNNSVDFERVAAVRRVIKKNNLNIHTKILKDENDGLRKSIIFGINEITKSYDAFIVLEDDIIISQNTILYAINMLNKFEDDEIVFHINFWNHPSINRNSAYLSQYMHCWGWASWSKYWSDIDFDKGKFEKLGIHDRFRITKYLSTLHLSHLYANYIGIRDTWAIFWLTHIIIKGGKCISPPISLSKNIGFLNGEHIESYDFDQKLSNIPKSVLLNSVETSYLSELKVWFNYIKSTRLLSLLNSLRIMILK
jgi:hypothetical protein